MDSSSNAPPGTASASARALARDHLTRAILASARTQLGTVGPTALSVRAVARDVGMASSAVYRYFPSRDDLLTALGDLLPADNRWRHRHGSPGHGRDHVLPAFLPPYATIPVRGGQLALGTWQSICLVDTNKDNPVRRVQLDFLAG